MRLFQICNIIGIHEVYYYKGLYISIEPFLKQGVEDIFLLLTFDTLQEKEKFEHIYDTYKKLLLYKSYSVLKDYSLAEDAVSEAYFRIYKNLHKIADPDSNQSIAFYVTIVKNTSLTLLSKNKKQATDTYDDALADTFNLEEHIIDNLSSEAIYNLVNQLSEDLKNVFLLKYAYDLSHKKIGETLGITENNVTVKIHRAKKKLAQIIAKEGGYL